MKKDDQAYPFCISVIVPVYQHWHLAFKLIEALSSQRFPIEKCQILLVDNGSDNVPDKSEVPDFITLLHCAKPGSYSARNEGLKHAKGRLIVFTDADCIPGPGWLLALWKQYVEGKDESLIAGAIQVKKIGSGVENDVEVYDRALGLPQQRYVKRGYAVTANLAIPAAIISIVGQFDDSRFSGGDADYCRRSAQNGMRITYCPDAVVVHPARSDINELKTKVKRVKGGQISAGSFGRRLKFFLRTFLPPIRAFFFVFRNNNLSPTEKARVCVLQVKIWGIEIRETIALVLGKSPERR